MPIFYKPWQIKLGKALLWGMVWVGTAQAEPHTTTVTLKNRPAAEILPLLQPLLGPSQKVAADGFKLVIQSENADLHTFKALIQELDTRQAQLVISIQNRPYPQPRPTAPDPSRSWETNRPGAAKTATLVLQDGQTGEMDTELPIPTWTMVDTPEGLSARYQYTTLPTHFQIHAQLHPDLTRVVVAITTTDARPSETTPSPRFQTRMTLPVSEWIPLYAHWDPQKGFAQWQWKEAPPEPQSGQSTRPSGGSAFKQYQTAERSDANPDTWWPVGLLRVDVME